MSEPNPADRLLESFRALVNTELVSLKYAGVFQYSIVAVNGAPPNVTIDCRPTDLTIDLPTLSQIPMQPDISGITSIPTTGLNCTVVFLNRNPALPRIIGVDSLGVTPIARLGDQVTSFFPPILAVNGFMNGVTPFVGTITVANPVSGIITQGSVKAYTG